MNKHEPIEWYPDELIFLKKNYFKMTKNQLLEEINSKRSRKIALTTMVRKCTGMGLLRGHQIRWSDSDVQYLKNNFRKYGDTELAQQLTRRRKTFRTIDGKRVCRTFNNKNVEKKRELLRLRRSDAEVLSVRKRNIRTGLAFAYSKEKNAWNTGKRKEAENGEIRIWKSGGNGKPFRWIKIDGSFRPYARWYYKKHIGPVADDKIVFHIDMDQLNDSPDNYEVRKKRRLSEKDFRRALRLITKRINEHLSSYNSGGYLKAGERLKYHQELIKLKKIQKNIHQKLNINHGQITAPEKNQAVSA